jgi:hypothetical protein
MTGEAVNNRRPPRQGRQSSGHIGADKCPNGDRPIDTEAIRTRTASDPASGAQL